MMNKVACKLGVHLISLLVTGVVGYGCSAKSTTITVLDAWGAGPWAGPMYKEWTTEFQRRNPDIKVKIIPVAGGETTFDKMTALLASGSPLDVALGSRSDFAVRGLLLNLRPLHTADPETKNRKYYPGCADYTSIRIDGKDFMWGMPGNPGTQVLFANLSLFDRAGIRFNSKDIWSYDEFIANGKKLTRDDNGDGKPDTWGATMGWGHISNFIHYIWNAGGDAYQTDPKTGFAAKCTLDSGNAVSAFKWIQELTTVHRIVPAGGAGFESGKLALAQNWWYYASTQTKTQFKWNMMGLPTPTGKSGIYLSNGSGMGSIIKSSKHPKEAWEFLKFVTGDEGDWIRNKYMPHPPILADSAYLPKWREAYPGIDLDVYLKACREGHLGTWSRLRTGEDRIDGVFGAAIGNFYNNKINATQFCQTVTKTINTILSTMKK